MYTSNSILRYEGYKGTIKDFAIKFDIPYNTLYNRLCVLGWTIHDAITVSVEHKANRGGMVVFECEDGLNRTIPEIADKYFINYGTLSYRLKKYNKDDLTFDIIKKEIDNIINKQKRNVDKVRNTKKINFIMQNKGEIDYSDPIYILCKKHNRDYTIVSRRIKQGFDFEESINIPLEFVNTRNLIYNDEINTLKYFCRKYKKDFVKCYEMLLLCYDFEYVIKSKETDL